MSKTSWPKIRTRNYQWQDKKGAVHKSASYQINCRLPNGKRFQQTFKVRKDAESVAARLRDERMVELKNRTVSLHNLNDEERIDVLEARRILDGKATLQQSAAFFLEHNVLPSGARRDSRRIFQTIRKTLLAIRTRQWPCKNISQQTRLHYSWGIQQPGFCLIITGHWPRRNRRSSIGISSRSSRAKSYSLG